jgi:hypothetical protein
MFSLDSTGFPSSHQSPLPPQNPILVGLVPSVSDSAWFPWCSESDPTESETPEKQIEFLDPANVSSSHHQRQGLRPWWIWFRGISDFSQF